MSEDAVFIESKDQKRETERPGRLYRMKVKSDNMEAIIAELKPSRESRWYKHGGEELHFVLEGELEYIVGEKSFKLNEGDILWHKSSIKHKAKNHSNKKVRYITVGTPPTFMISEI